MFDYDTNATGPVPRRSVLKTAGGLLVGATAVAGRSTALPDRRGPVRIEIEEVTEEVIVVRGRLSADLYERVNERGALRECAFLGLGDQFIMHDDEDAVSLPEDTEGLANPVEITPIESATSHGNLMYFRTGDIDWPNEYEKEEVTLGLGVFPERTIGDVNWNTDDVGVVRGPSDADG